jgi:hypothetical protein
MLLFVFSIDFSFASTASDRSDIVVQYHNFSWNGLDAGWQADECLISPTNTLDYPLHLTNRNGNAGSILPVTSDQYVVSPVYLENWGEQTNNEFDPNDDVDYASETTGSHGDVSELWLTWDSTWVYAAVKAEYDNRGSGVCLMLMFDRGTGTGVVDFSGADPAIGLDTLTPGTFLWSKGIYFRNFNCDFYIGTWYDYNGGMLGDCQLCAITNFANPTFHQIIIENETVAKDTVSTTNYMDRYYNLKEEFRPLQRVFTVKFAISQFTNGLSASQVRNMKFKVIANTVAGGTGAGGRTFDFCPDNLAGMNPDNKSVEDNFFTVPFTDGSGNVLMGVRPCYDATVQFLPGSRRFTEPVVDTSANMTNLNNGNVASRRIFIPANGESIDLKIAIPVEANVLSPSLTIYNLRGAVVRTLVASGGITEIIQQTINGTNTNILNYNWTAGDTSVTYHYIWDGKTSAGVVAPLGNYIAVYTGVTEDGLGWTSKFPITLVR